MHTSLINEAMEIEVHATDQNAAIVSVHMERPSTAIVCFNQILVFILRSFTIKKKGLELQWR
jgi:hypothetical protein